MNGKQMGREQHPQDEPTIAPGMETNDDLREEATEDEVDHGEYTEVTQLIIDRTPNEEE
ncbi:MULTISPECIES: hypothetical protein [unclassified Paenibacillus]|uniref:hypothetical protein n=1 Tax=unclassified Paenibacillus TaxID=185978 RepID=UPI000B0E27FE|nr:MULTISPECIES: hypothetical protein [unclassified Paenibacillus]MCT1403625.1 hypothetical protein [Paenibacillus sp. p3-SID867]